MTSVYAEQTTEHAPFSLEHALMHVPPFMEEHEVDTFNMVPSNVKKELKLLVGEIKSEKQEMGMVAHVCNPRVYEAEVEDGELLIS